LLDLDWKALVDPEATLAVYMGKSSAGEIARGLMGAGLPASLPVGLLENVSLPDERHFITRLDLLPLAAKTSLGEGPAILLIGETLSRSVEGNRRLGHADRSSRVNSSTCDPMATTSPAAWDKGTS